MTSDNDFKEKLKVENTGYRPTLEDIDFFNKLNEATQQRAVRKFTAPKNTAKWAAEKARHTGAKIGIAIAGVALVAGMVGGKIGNSQGRADLAKENTNTFTDLNNSQNKVENYINNLGISQEDMDTLQDYRQYFDDENSNNITSKNLIEVTQDLYDLDLNLIKQKISGISEYKPYELVVRPTTEREGSGGGIYQHTRIYEKDNEIGQQPLFSENNQDIDKRLPGDIHDMAWLTTYIDDIKSQLENKSISQENAYKKLKEYYQKIDEFASRQVIKGKDGKLAIVDYTEYNKLAEKEEEQKEQNER